MRLLFFILLALGVASMAPVVLPIGDPGQTLGGRDNGTEGALPAGRIEIDYWIGTGDLLARKVRGLRARPDWQIEYCQVGSGLDILRLWRACEHSGALSRWPHLGKGADPMEFQEAVKSGFDNLTNFEGRATRSEFWWFWAAIAVPAIILNVIFVSFIPFVGWLIGLAATVLTLSAAVRRLHDSGRPGMWMVPFFAVTTLITLLALIALFSGAWLLALLVSYLGGFIQLIVGLVVLFFLVQAGDAGPNRYGPPRT